MQQLCFSNFWPGRFLSCFLPNAESALGRVSGAELPGRFQVSLPRAVMLNESVEKIPRIRQAYPGAFQGPAPLPGFVREAF